MKLSINGDQENIPEACTIEELLAYKNVEQPLMVTVELNGVILKKTEFSTVKVKDNDAVEFLYFMGGGSEG